MQPRSDNKEKGDASSDAKDTQSTDAGEPISVASKEPPFIMIIPDCCKEGRDDCTHTPKRIEKRPINPSV